MSKNTFKKMLGSIMRYAWRLYREGCGPFSECLRLSWSIIRSKLYVHKTRIRGTQCFQKVLKGLLLLGNGEFELHAIRERGNAYDPNAIAIYVAVGDGFIVKKVGYLSKYIAARYCSVLDLGGYIKVIGSNFTGIRRNHDNIGCNISYVVLE